MPDISERSKNYMGSPIRKLAAMIEKAGFDPDMISFGGGAPSLTPPKEVLEEMCRRVKENPQKTTAYCSTIGLPKTRQAISDDLKEWEKIDIPADSISITTGGTEALYVTLQTLLDPGDEIITSDPSYLGYREPIKLTGAKEVMIPTTWEKDFQINQEKVKEALGKKTKAILIASPDNPTGTLYNKDSLKFLTDVAEDHDLWLITDDIYKHIVFKGKFTNSRCYGAEEKTITCCSFSKTASVPGLRIGYLYGPEKVVRKISEIKQATTLTPSRTAQYAVRKFLENKGKIKREYLSKVVIPTYKARKEKMQECIDQYLAEANYSEPNGAFYFFPDINKYLERMNMNELQFADMLLKEEKVVVVPGRFFGAQGKGHVRLTFVSETEERIEKGFQRMQRFIERHSKHS